jgi:sugar transferase (PEP-CTERM system associated)
MRLFNRFCSVYELLLILGDITLTVSATVATRILVVFAKDLNVASWTQWMTLAAVITGLIVASFYYADLYDLDQTLSQRELILRFLNGFGVACVIIGLVSYPIHEPGSKKIYLIELMLMGGGLFLWRLAFTEILKRGRIGGNVAIIGTQKIGRIIAEELCRKKHLGMKVSCFLGSEAGSITLTYGNPRKVTIPVFPLESTVELVHREGINRILVAEAENGPAFPAHELVSLRLQGIPIEYCHTFYERLMSKISVAELQPGWLVFSRGFRRTRWTLFAKRLIDIVGATTGLILTAPISLITAIAIKLDSHGPVLYCQERVGENESTFTVCKFRSMLHDAETKTGPVWASGNDPRVTRVGRIIRKLRIDEIPQMLNVLKGEMSFVGPRPERPFFVSQLKQKIPYYHLRFTLKPGITGWAQISYPYGSTEDDALEKLQFDLYYIKNISPLFDLQILFETVKVVLLSRGAR